jgi:hypothetical protein
MNPELSITKLDAARRQLETAIRLYFQNGDAVSIHTLTAASYNIMRDINVTRGGDPMIAKQQLLETIKPEFQKMVRNKINEAENFFKHADNDSLDMLLFNPRQTEILLIDACSQYFKLTAEDRPLCIIYRGWFIANYPELFNLSEEHTWSAEMILQMGRIGYFRKVISNFIPDPA